MKLKKIVAAAVAAVLSLTMLTACGGGGGGGVTVKKVAYEESRMGQVESTDQMYLETTMVSSGIAVDTKLAIKGDKKRLDMYHDGAHWATMLYLGDKKYEIDYPEYPGYQYTNENGEKLNVPVYEVSAYQRTESENPEEVEVGTYSIGNKSYYAESYTTKKGVKRYVCFDGMTLVAIVDVETGKQPDVMLMKNFRNTDVPDSLFELPADAVNADTLS